MLSLRSVSRDRAISQLPLKVPPPRQTPTLASRPLPAVRRALHYRAGRLRRLPRRIRYRGNAVACPVCLGRSAAFIPHGPARPAALCPRCGAAERHRGLVLYLERRTDLFTRPSALLHVAPEPELERRLSRLPDLSYTTTDLSSPYAQVHADLEDLPFPTDSFDAILCSHVLEHVSDDGRALAELARVLRPSGWAALLVPVDVARAVTYEDTSIVRPAARREAFGQGDHVRVYGADFPERVRRAGLHVEVDRWLMELDEATIRRFGLGHDPIYRCRPSRG